MRGRLSIALLLAFGVAQLGGCSSCVKEDEAPAKPIEPLKKPPMLGDRGRITIKGQPVVESPADAAATD